jgi:hypothetical protein
MAGTQSVQADDLRILGIPRSRQTVAIIYPQYGTVLQGFPFTSEQVRTSRRKTPSLCQCSARAAQDIWEHHRPAVGSSMRALGSEHSTSEKLGSKLSGGRRHHQRAGSTGACPTRCEMEAIGRQMSHSLSESTRQITPPIRSGHAPPSEGSRKSSQSVHPSNVLTW